MDILIAVLLNFIVAPFIPFLFRLSKNTAAWLVSLLPVAWFLIFLRFLPLIQETGFLTFSYNWIPSLNIQFAFYLDGLSLLFALLITGIGAFIFLYSKDYLKHDPHLGRFFTYLVLFMGSMLGLVLAGNLISLYVFWELTTISSFLLIGYHNEEIKSRKAALQALLVTNVGGLALLAGIILLGQAAGSYELETILNKGEIIRQHPHYAAIFLLILFGAVTKSAQVPFHFWLPNAMAAPTPVSAYLHSATMVKGGIYLLARLSPVLNQTDLWMNTVPVIGGLTLLTGAWMAIVQTDIKRLLAYSTVSVLGMLVLMLGIGSETAVKGAVIYLFAHALYKATLFMCAGVIDHKAGTRDITRMGGLAGLMPLVALGGIMAAVSKSGLPPAIGLIGKELIYESGLHFLNSRTLLILVLLFSNMFLAAVAWQAGIAPFFGRRKEDVDSPAKPSPLLWLGPLVLGTLGLVFGLFPQLIEKAILQPAVSAVAGRTVPLHLALWHGFNPAVLLSLLTIAGALALFFSQNRLRGLTAGASLLRRLGPEHLYELLLTSLQKSAGFLTRRLQSGYQRRYLIIILSFTAFLVW